MISVGLMTRSKVKDNKTFAEYARQELGTPYPMGKEWPATGKLIQTFFDENPDANWESLCKVVDFSRNRKWREPNLMSVVSLWRKAWAAGYLPELDPKEKTDPKVEQGIEKALTMETDPEWREKLMASTGMKARREVLVAWMSERWAT